MQAPTPPAEDAPAQEWAEYYKKQSIYYDAEAVRTDVNTDQALFTYGAEELTLQQQIDREEAEYQAALADILRSQQNYDDTYSALQREQEQPGSSTDPYEGLTESEKAEYIQYEKDLAAYNAYIEKRNRDLPRGKELQELGLIPVDATNQEVLAYLEQYEASEKKKEDELISRVTSLGGDVRLLQKHKKLVKAHNEFQKKYRQKILNARYGKTIKMAAYYPWFELREVGGKYEAFGTTFNKNPRNVKIFRSFYSIFDPEDKETDWKEYNYVNGEWQESVNWKSTWKPVPEPLNTDTKVNFYKSGKFPKLPWMSDEYTSSDAIGAKIPSEQGKFLKGNWNTKRGFSKCARGYWFYEDIPEEASRCIYMGTSMVDNNFSYYPESVGFTYSYNQGAAVHREQAAAAARTPAQEEELRRCLDESELFGVSNSRCYT